MKRFLKSNIFLFVVCIACWELIFRTNFLKGDMASPFGVVAYLTELSNMFNLLSLLLTTMVYSLSAVTLGLILGYTVAVLGFYWQIHWIYRLAVSAKSIPVTALLPIFIAIFGLEKMVLPMVVLPVSAMICVNIWDSSLRLSLQRIQVKKMMGISFFKYFKDVMFWETLEVVIATARISLPYALALVVALDYFMGNVGGAGDYINKSSYSYNVNGVYSAILFIAVAGIMQIAVFDKFSKKLLIWK